MKSYSKTKFASLPDVFCASSSSMTDDVERQQQQQQFGKSLFAKSRSLHELKSDSSSDSSPPNVDDVDSSNDDDEICEHSTQKMFTNEELARLGFNYEDFTPNKQQPICLDSLEPRPRIAVTSSSPLADERYEFRENLAAIDDQFVAASLASNESDVFNANFDEIMENLPADTSFGEEDREKELVDEEDVKLSIIDEKDENVESANKNAAKAGNFDRFSTPVQETRAGDNPASPPLSPLMSFERALRSDRFSMPAMTHSWSHLDIPHSVSVPGRFNNDADDEVFDAGVKRVASISSINVEKTVGDEGETQEMAVCGGDSQEDEGKSVSDVETAKNSDELTVPPVLERMLSISTPSVSEMRDETVLQMQADSLHATETIENRDEVQTRQKNAQSPQHQRSSSVYAGLPHITPRIPLMGLLPSSVRRPSEKPLAVEQQPKEKEKHHKDKEKKSFFRKTKESKHSWTKVTTDCSVETCAVCPNQLFSNFENYTCNECGIFVHIHCKEHVDKVPCSKIKLAKRNSGPLAHHTSLNIPTRPTTVGRFSSLREDSGEERVNDNNTNRMIAVDLSRGGLPGGFYASTMPHSDWDAILNLWVEDPEPWCDTIGREAKKPLSSKEVKRQNTIHDLYITEKHHCQTLVALKHTYFDGMAFFCKVPVDDLHRLMPKLDDLLVIHMNFLRLLCERKSQSIVVGAIHEDLLSQFTGEMGQRMVAAYTAFCSQKDDTVRIYHNLLKENLQFKTLISNINASGFYKTMSLPDCLLKITQRLSKYHQFVESLSKQTTDDSLYKNGMTEAEAAVKHLIMAVDSGIDRVQMEFMRQAIVKRMEPKAVVEIRTKEVHLTFSSKDMAAPDRTLLNVSNVTWPNAKRNSIECLLLLFSDVIVFLQNTGSGQYNFFSQDNKCGVVSLRKMIVRDKAGRFGSEGVYLIATFPKPEMYEIRCKTKKENSALIARVQRAVENCVATSVETNNEFVAQPEPCLITAEDEQQLQTLFDKLPTVNEKLKSYYEELINAYEEITNFVLDCSGKIRNEDERLRFEALVKRCLDSQTVALTPNLEFANLFGNILQERLRQQVEDSRPTRNATPPPLAGASEALGRSNTFHYIRNSGRRRALRKHVTVTGIPAERSEDRSSDSKESSVENMDVVDGDRPGESMKDISFLMLKKFSDSQVIQNELREQNIRLQAELSLIREQMQHKNRHTMSNNTSYNALEELRKLQANLDVKKKEFSQMADDKECDLNRREKAIAEREAKLERDDHDLRAKWTAFHQREQQQRFGVLPVSPMSPPMSNGTSPSSDLHTVATPTLYYHPPPVPIAQFYGPPPAYYHQGAPAAAPMPSTPTMHRHRSSSSDVPPTLQGSLLHGGGGIPETSRPIMPSHLRANSTGGDSLSSRLSLNPMARASSKKKGIPTSAHPNQQVLPKQLSSSNIGNSKKKS